MILKQPNKEELIKSAIESDSLVIVCPNCQSKHMLETVSRKYEVTEHKGAFEIGIECPECKLWTHSFFTNARLNGLRQKLDKSAALVTALGQVTMPAEQRMAMANQLMKEYRKRQKNYARAFNAYNDMMRKKYDVRQHPHQRESSGSYHTA